MSVGYKDGEVVCPKCGSRNTHDHWSNPDDHGLNIIHNWRCHDCGWDDSKKAMTNGDKIRAMSDEELAPMLTPKVMFCNGCPANCPENKIPTIEDADTFGAKTAKDICVARVENWLKQEAKDE